MILLRRDQSFIAAALALMSFLGCSSASGRSSAPQVRCEVDAAPQMAQTLARSRPTRAPHDIVGIPGADGDTFDFRESRFCLRQPARAVRLRGEGNRIALPLQVTLERVILPQEVYFEKTITLKPSGALVIPVHGLWYWLEEPQALEELGNLTVERFQPCAVASARLSQVLSAVMDRFHVKPLPRCRWKRYLEEIPETSCTMVKEVEELGLDRFTAAVSEGNKRVVSVVVANSAIMYHVLSSQGHVACPPVQASTTKRALVASLAVLQTEPSSEQSVEFWPRGCFRAMIGTIEGEAPSSKELTDLLDSVVAHSAKTSSAPRSHVQDR